MEFDIFIYCATIKNPKSQIGDILCRIFTCNFHRKSLLTFKIIELNQSSVWKGHFHSLYWMSNFEPKLIINFDLESNFKWCFHNLYTIAPDESTNKSFIPPWNQAMLLWTVSKPSLLSLSMIIVHILLRWNDCSAEFCLWYVFLS